MKKRSFGHDLAGTIMINNAIYNSRPLVNTTVEEIESSNIFAKILAFENKTYKYMLTSLLDFVVYEIDNETPSVAQEHKVQDDYRLPIVAGNYELLIKVTLKEHLLRCYLIAHSKYHHEAEFFKTIVCICALAHDIGKIPIVAAKYKYVRHDIASAEWLADFYTSRHFDQGRIDESVLDLCYKTLSVHHQSSRNEKNIYIDTLCTIDQKAREEEVAAVKKIISENTNGKSKN